MTHLMLLNASANLLSGAHSFSSLQLFFSCPLVRPAVVPCREQKHADTNKVRTHTYTVSTKAVDNLYYDKYEKIMLLELARMRCMFASAYHKHGLSDLFPARTLWTACKKSAHYIEPVHAADQGGYCLESIVHTDTDAMTMLLFARLDAHLRELMIQ